MKSRYKTQKSRLFKLSILLSLATVGSLGLASPALAEVLITQPEDGPFYIENTIGPDFYIKSTKKVGYEKSFALEPYINQVKIDFKVPILNKYCPHLEKLTFGGIYKSDMRHLPKINDENFNTVAIKYWNGSEYEYKAFVALPVDGGPRASRGTCFPPSNMMIQLASTINKSNEVQTAIYEAIKVGDEAVAQVMTKYLPQLAFVMLDDDQFAKVTELANNKNEDINLEELNITKELFDEGVSIESLWTFGKVYGEEAYFPQVGETGPKYAYQNIVLQDGDIWRPLDHAVEIINASEGTYQLPSAWITGTADNTAVKAEYSNDFLKPPEGRPIVDNSISATEAVPVPFGSATAIPVKKLETGRNSLIDLQYGDKYSNLFVDEATLGQNTIFKIRSNVIRIENAKQNKEQIDANEKTNLYIQFTDGEGLGKKPFYKTDEKRYGIEIAHGNENFEVTGQTCRLDGVFANYEITPEIQRVDNIIKTEKSQIKYKQDAEGNYLCTDGGNQEQILMNEEKDAPFKPVDPDHLTDAELEYLRNNRGIWEKDELGNTAYTHTIGSTWVISGYSYEDTGEVAERGRTVSENSSIMRNLLRVNNKNLFRRADQLRPSNLARITEGGQGPILNTNDLRGEARENIWADVWHGKFSPKAGYGRTADQSYNGVQVGYDKLLDKKFYNGKVYTGVYGSMMDGDSTTQTGEGEQKAYGLGVYSTWLGDRGHFLDLGMNATKLKNEYWLTGNTGEGDIGKIDASNSTWAYGIGAQYGMRNQLTNNWFWEPSVSFYVGHVHGSEYFIPGLIEVTQEMYEDGYRLNNMKIKESGYDTAIGRVGLKTGYNVKDEANFYAGISYAHDFADGPRLEQSIGTRKNQGNIIGKSLVFDSVGRKIEAYEGNDSWWEWSLGANAKISDNGIFNIDYLKTTGSDLGDDWSIKGGLSFTWDGWANTVKGADGKTNFTKAHNPTVVIGQRPDYERPTLPQLQENQRSYAGGSSTNVATDTGVSGGFVEGTGDFYMGGVTVEAERPDWEKALSPGQVSVIYPSQFAGEQKNLAEMLDRVPGLYIQRLNGYGHYNVARMRGSTAAQVAVYVDGVAMNLTGDAAVNLNAIPAENIERIEVYRGYVPARFAGAPLGGVINILTRRPNEGHGHVSQGYRDYGGYTGTYEYSMPLGEGSLLATYSRDIWQGDFDWIWPNRIPDGDTYRDAEYKRRSNDYQNNNALIKWQDDKWTIKAAWKKSQEGLAVATNEGGLVRFGYRDNIQTIDHKEFQVGRRDTLGNLDLGWHVAYIDNDKHFNNVGLRRLIADSEKGTLPPRVAPFYETQAVPGQIWGIYHSKKWNGNLNASMKMGSSHLLEFNGDITLENMECNGNGWNTKTQTNWVTDHSSTGEGRFIRAMLPEYKNKEYHLTLQDTMTLNQAGDFKLTAIGRADKVDMEGIGPSGDGRTSWKYSGGVALQKQLDENLSIKSTWGTYNRHPNFYEIFGDGCFIRSNYVYKDDDGNPVNPDMWESGTQFDISLNWQGKLAKADTDTVLTYYRRNSKNQLVLWTPRGGDGISTYLPTDELDSYGIELAHNMQWNRLGLALAATWQKSKTSGGLSWESNWGALTSSFVPEWVLSARVDYLLPGDKLNVFGEYRYTDNEVIWGSNSEKGVRVKDAYSIIDLGAKYTFDKNWRLTAGVNDLLDKGREVFIDNTRGPGGGFIPNYYPLPGRMYYTTLEYSF